MTMNNSFTKPLYLVSTRFEGGFITDDNDLMFGYDCQVFTTPEKARGYFNDAISAVRNRFASATNPVYSDTETITPEFTCDVLDNYGNRWECIIEVTQAFPDPQPWEL